MFTILIGKTSSGKTLIKEELIKRGFSGITTYTTRPIRNGEIPDVTYHFITEEEFNQKIKEDFFAEWKTYDTEFGTWYYGTSLHDLESADDMSVIILTPEGFRDVINKLTTKPKSIYVYANNPTIMKRLELRGDDKNEARRRLDHDNLDFKGVENEVDKIVFNNDGDDINNVVDKIIAFIKGE